MSELNFDEGIAMPVANLENKQLESEVRFTLIDEVKNKLYRITSKRRSVSNANN